MGRRRAPYRIKVQLPADDPDSESDTESDTESEKKAGGSDSTNLEEGNSSGGEQSDTKEEDEEEEEDSAEATSSAETKPRVKKSGGDAGSSDDSDLEETVRSRLRRLTKKANISAEASSSDESSGSEDEQPRESKSKQKVKKERGDSSTVERAGDAEKSSSGSEDDSDTEDEANQETPMELDGKASDVGEESEDDEETEDEQQYGSDTDSEEEYVPQEEADADEDAQSEDLDDLVEESELESGDEWEKDALRNESEPTDDEDEALCTPNDRNQAKRLLRNVLMRVPLVEETAIRRGVRLSGPPLEHATTHSDEYARKFRWPQHVRNLRKTDFSQDPLEILEDYEVVSGAQQSRSDQGEQGTPQESAFAQVPRPIVALAAEALRRSSRKRRRNGSDGGENQTEPSEEGPSAATLLNIARVGGQFGDHFVESLLTANARALQGIDDGFDYDKRCWSSLPTKKKPIANWRFVLEHVRRTMCKSDRFRDVMYPAMKPETLERITKRLKKLYGHTTQHEEYDVFEHAKPSSSENDEESKAEF